MLDMVWTSIKLFLAGRLFQKPLVVFGLSVAGVAITIVVACLGLFILDLAPALAAAISGLVGGFVQPYLFKDLKYR